MKITVNPRLFKMLGKGMYNSHSLIVTVRELIQNGRDSAIRAKRDPQLILDVKHTSLDGVKCWRVSLTDNGEGLSSSDIENKLLSLAGECKTSESIGGFGIAKLVLLSGLRFEVWTHNIYFDSDILNQDGDPETTADFIDGARVIVWIEDSRVYSYVIAYALAMARFCSVPITINYTDREGGFKTWESPGYQCGPPVTNGEDNGNLWTLTLDAGNESYNVYRLGGLVQFITSSGNRPGTNAIIDVKTTARPGSDNYPFTTARESLQASLQSRIDDILSGYDIDPLTAQMTAAEIREKPDLRVKNNVMFHHCKGWRPDKFDRRILKVWDYILSHITYEDYKTGYVKKYADAERYEGAYGLFYLIDPDTVDGKTVDAIVYDLYDLAAHEVTHKNIINHNETFEVNRHSRYTGYTEELSGMVSYVKRYILRNR